jgi:hypothetical protein
MRSQWEDDPELQELMRLEEEERRNAAYQRPAPSAMPQPGYLDPLYQSALAEMERWVDLYEEYRMQGGFAQMEPIFQTVHQLLGR